MKGITMPKIHFWLQGKGGVGKSTTASWSAQFYKYKHGEYPLLIDTDPINTSLSFYRELPVEPLEGMIVNMRLVPTVFDDLMDKIQNTEKDVIVDNGSDAFIRMNEYFIRNSIPEIIKEMGHELYIHTVINGGGNSANTLNGFKLLCENYHDNMNLVVWVSQFYGPIHFEGLDIYAKNKKKIAAIISLEEMDPDFALKTYGTMAENMWTFSEALEKPEFGSLVKKQRLINIRDNIFSRIDAAGIL